MDGAPVRGESIPIRVFLAGYDLAPSMKDINKKFSVRYYLNLVLMDEEDRRYFKQQEITLWRKGETSRRSLQHTHSGSASPLEGAPAPNMLNVQSYTARFEQELPPADVDDDGVTGTDSPEPPLPITPHSPPSFDDAPSDAPDAPLPDK